MLRDLLTSEAQNNWYAWGAVALSHAFIGIFLAVLLPVPVIAVAASYAAFEVIQGKLSGRILWWDSFLDWTAVVLGAQAASFLMMGDRPRAALALLSVALVAFAGAYKRLPKTL